MSDPVGSIGAPKADNDLNIALNGGGNFMSRLSRLADAKEAAEAALAALQLGNDIQAIRDDAEHRQADAMAKQAEAEKVLADAKAQAAAIVADAQRQAGSVMQDAQDKAAQVRTDAVSVRSDGESYAADMKAKADQAMKDAESLKAQAAEQFRLSMEQTAAVLQSKYDANFAKDAADKAKADFDAKLAKLHAVLAELTA